MAPLVGLGVLDLRVRTQARECLRGRSGAGGDLQHVHAAEDVPRTDDAQPGVRGNRLHALWRAGGRRHAQLDDEALGGGGRGSARLGQGAVRRERRQQQRAE